MEQVLATQALPDQLAERRRQVEMQLLADWQARSRRRREGRYLTNLPWAVLTAAQRAERLDVAQDVLIWCDEWRRIKHLFNHGQTEFLADLAGMIRASRGRYGIGPAEWERLWQIRDLVLW